MDSASSLLVDLSDDKAVIKGLLLLQDSLRRKEDVQRISNELLRLFHACMEMSDVTRHTVALTMILQRFTDVRLFLSFPFLPSSLNFFVLQYCKVFGLAARVHVGSGAPFAALVSLLQGSRGMVHFFDISGLLNFVE